MAPAMSLSQSQLDGLWVQAVAAVETPGFLQDGLEVSPALPKSCPVGLHDFLQPGLALSDLEDRIRSSAATG